MGDTRFITTLNRCEQEDIFRLVVKAVMEYGDDIPWEEKLEAMSNAMHCRVVDVEDYIDKRWTVGDMFTQEFYDEIGDVDVMTDVYPGERFSAFCGPLLLKEDGRNAFQDILGVRVEISAGGDSDDPMARGYDHVTCRLMDYYKNPGARHQRLRKLFDSAARNCTDEEYNRWFKDPNLKSKKF